MLVKTQFGEVSSAVSISPFFQCYYTESKLGNSLINIGIVYLCILLLLLLSCFSRVRLCATP